MSLAREVERLSACPACGHPSSSLTLHHPEPYMADGLCVYRCDACLLFYLNPRLTADAVQALEDQSVVYDFTPALIEEKNGTYTALVAFFERYVKQRGRLLDVGCNRGLLLEAARRRGWQVSGVELSPVAAERARSDFGLDVFASLDDLASLAPFDLVVCWHVLEHTADPVAFLRQIGGLLADDGIVALQVPSFDFRAEFERRSEAYKLLCAVHNFYFTAQNIEHVFNRAGMDVVEVVNNPEDLMLTVIAGHAVDRNQRGYIRQLEATIRAKDEHIERLEVLLRRIENGRLMRMLRLIRR